MARAIAALLALSTCACTQHIEVFTPRGGAGGAGGSGGGAPLEQGGAGGDAPWKPPDAGQMSVPDPDDAFNEPSPCGRCGVTQLCAVDKCVDAEPITTLDTSFNHTCIVRGGQLFCWGKNEAGQLGTGDEQDRNRPARVGNFNDWLAVSAGEHATCALRAPGRLYCFGDGAAGALGLGDTSSRNLPVAVEDLGVVQSIACGGNNCCAIDQQGMLFCWGDNLEGKVGQDDPYGSPDALAPKRVQRGTRWRAVDVGQGHVCAIRDNGELYCWGRNVNGELGIGSNTIQFRVPMRVGAESDWTAVSASQHHSCGVRGNGALLCWGHNGSFEVGSPDRDTDLREPFSPSADLDWVEVGVGWFHTCARKRDQQLYCVGRAIEGQLGVMSEAELSALTAVRMPDRYSRVALGNFHSCALDAAGALYCWGANNAGQLGLGDNERRHAPAAVQP